MGLWSFISGGTQISIKYPSLALVYLRCLSYLIKERLHEDLSLCIIANNNHHAMKKVLEIFKRKGRNTISIHPDATVFDALKLMADRNIGSVVVLHHEQYLGLMTERDYSRKVILMGKSSNDTRVKDIMTTDLPRVSSEHTLEDCMQLMSNKNIRYLPVFDQGKYTGIISINDVVRETISSQQETIEHLQNFLYSS